MAIYSSNPCSDIERPGTWKKYHEELCNNCLAPCCYLVIEVTAEDLIRLGITDEDEVAYDIRNLVKRLKKEGIITRCNIPKGRFTLAQQKKGGCRFLNSQSRCSVYEDRPDVCRLHPTRLSPRPGYCAWIPAE